MSSFNEYTKQLPFDPELGSHISKRVDVNEELYECSVFVDPDNVSIADLLPAPMRQGQSLTALSTQSSDPDESGPSCSSRTSGTHRISSLPTLLKINPDGPYFTQMTTIFKTLTRGESPDYIRGVADALSKVQMMVQSDMDSKRMVMEARTDLMEKIHDLTNMVETLTMRTAPTSAAVSPGTAHSAVALQVPPTSEMVTAAFRPWTTPQPQSSRNSLNVTSNPASPPVVQPAQPSQLKFTPEHFGIIAGWGVPNNVYSGFAWAQGKLLISNFQLEKLTKANSEAEKKLILRDLISAMYGQSLMAVSEMRIMLDDAMKWKPGK